MTLPRPAPTAMFMHPDLHIKSLAQATDAALASSVKVVYLGPTALDIDINGDIWPTFPGLTTIAGCLVNLTHTQLYGQVKTLPPVPPGSIGRSLLTTACTPIPVALRNDGIVQVRVMTQSQYRGVTNGVQQYYGSQPAASGQKATLYGWAWGPA